MLFDIISRQRVLGDMDDAIHCLRCLTDYRQHYPGELEDFRLFCFQHLLNNYDQVLQRDDLDTLQPSVLVELMRLRQGADGSGLSGVGGLPYQYGNPQSPGSPPVTTHPVGFPTPNFGQSTNSSLALFKVLQELQKQFVQDMKKLLEDSANYDYSLVVGDKSFGVHSAILAARCAFFAGAFRSTMRESKNRSMRVLIGEVEPPPEAFESLLAYIYTGRADFTPYQAVYLGQAAGFYGFSNDRLSLLCQKRILQNLSVANSLKILAASYEVNALETRATAMECIVRNFTDIALQSQEEMARLPKRVLLDIMMAYAEEQRGGSASPKVLSP